MTFLEKIRSLLHTNYYLAAMLAVGCLVNAFGLEVQGTVFFVLLICVLLFVCSDILVTTAPFMMLAMTVITCYDSYETFIKLWWLAIPFAAALLYRLFVHSRKPFFGRSFWGMLAVTLAVTLGGIGTITQADYFNKVSLYYVFGLGLGMVAAYIFLATQVKCGKNNNNREFFAKTMYISALLGVFMIFRFILSDLSIILEADEIPSIQWANNLTTFLIITMPFVFHFTKRRAIHLTVGLLIAVAIMLSCSRGGWIMGGVEYVICSVAGIILDKKHRLLNGAFLVGSVLAVSGVIYQLRSILLKALYYNAQTGSYNFIGSSEPRVRLYERMKEDFASNRIFGCGLGYSGNSDVYDPKYFAMHWYHSAPMQILGSLGLFGVAAYLVQVTLRLVTLIKNIDSFKFTVLLSFIGLWLVSLVNPGIFCPVPYEFLAVMMFVLVEAADRNERKPMKVIVMSEDLN
ncbi:MAG TPA: O-antigen ligase family protein [Bacillota bacterium]|nr:O-antigen ligase family protein [Bacillota bacterium]